MVLCKKCGYTNDCFIDDLSNGICPECKDSWLIEKFIGERKYFWVIGYRGERNVKFYTKEQAERYEKRTGWKIFPV